MTITSKVQLGDGTDAVVAIDIDMDAEELYAKMSHDLDKAQYKSWFLATANHQIILSDNKDRQQHQIAQDQIMDVAEFLISNKTKGS